MIYENCAGSWDRGNSGLRLRVSSFMANLEASLSLCDPMNPGFGYQLRIVRVAAPGAPVDVLFTSRNPVTGEDLLTFGQCLDVLAMYREPAK